MNPPASGCHYTIAKLESRGSRGFREILEVNSLRTRVGFGFFVAQLANSKPQTPRRGIVDSSHEPGFWMGLPRIMNTGGFVTSRKWGFIEIKILKNRMKAKVHVDGGQGTIGVCYNQRQNFAVNTPGPDT